MTKKTALILIVLFAAIGLVDTIYLSYHTIVKTLVACPFFPDEWCRIVQTSSYSRTLGIPNSFAGFGMYVALLAMAYLWNSGRMSFRWLRYLIYFGFAFSMYFVFVQAFVLQAFCTWCVVSAVNFTVLFVVALLLREEAPAV